MTSDQRPTLGPGWYEAPDLPGALRYWDGEDWTEQYEVKKEDPRPVTAWTIAKGILLAILVIGLALWLLAFAQEFTA